MIVFKLININNHYRSNRVNYYDRNLSRRCKITVWQLAMGIYIPLPYCHRDMILGIARKFHDSMWLECISKEISEQWISLCFWNCSPWPNQWSICRRLSTRRPPWKLPERQWLPIFWPESNQNVLWWSVLGGIIGQIYPLSSDSNWPPRGGKL